ncbi:hypothetical protein GCM10022254_10040 [Actinomadura meridiana]|uniref:Uncharacterized protein n=1 Tax=Actinomadura meridiana TaxID=559626 RepID=A0ABP8BU07_9ACTN
MSLGMMYTAQFSGVAVSAQQDLFEVVAPSDAVVILHQLVVSQTTETGDAQEEGLLIQLKRGATTSGSSGASVTPVPLQAGFTAAGSTVEANNTTKASSGTIVTLHSEAWNVRAPFVWLPPPEARIVVSPSARLTVELGTTPNDSITMAGTLVFEELGG